jgi:rubrerythrin
MTTNETPAGLSVWEREVYDLLVDHVTKESEVVDEYDELLERSTGHVRFLLKLIIEDELRHHELYQEWAKTFRSFGTFEEPVDGVPNIVQEVEPERLIAALERLLALEKDDARQLKDLEKQFKDFRRTTIWPLLTELMAADTDKHIRILEFLLNHARQTARDEGKRI